jgi:hypothetical protein
VRADVQLRQLLRLEATPGDREIEIFVEGAVGTFIRAFQR